MSEFAQGILGQLKEPDNRTISEWAVGNVILPHSKRAREWSEDTAYWLIEPLNAIPENEAVSLCKPTQTGGTTLYEVFLSWLIANSPADAAMMGQTDTDAEYLFRAKILPTLKASPATADLIAAVGRNDITKNRLELGTMSFRIHGPGKNSLQSASVEILLLDEAWLFPLGTILEILERTSTKEATRKIVTVSQAGEQTEKGGVQQWDEWGAWWHRGTQEVYRVVCPHCGERFEPATELFKAADDARDPQSKEWDWKKVRETAHCETPCCKTKIENTPTNRRSLSASGRYFPTNLNPAPRHRSFRYPSWVVYWQDWGSLLEMFLRAQEALKRGNIEPLKIWTQKKEARWWTIKDQEIPSFKERKFFGYKTKEFTQGEVWQESSLRLMAVDMQADCFKCAIRDFRPGGDSRSLGSWTVKDWGEVAQLQARYRVPAYRVAVDAQNWTQDVYRQCATRKWVALHGSSGKSWQHNAPGGQRVARPFSPVRQGRVAVHTPKESGGRPGKPASAYSYEWSNLFFKDWLSRLVAGQGAAWEYPDDASDEYIAALDSEARKVGKDGKPLWEKIGQRPNHFWDCECMTLVLASIIGAADPQLAVFAEAPIPEAGPEGG
jgi:phage terminase large subunit GpA-like protein